MSNDEEVRISKRLSYVLRHRPDSADIELDANGWVDVESLVIALGATGAAVRLDEIEHVVATSDKQRFELVDGGVHRSNFQRMPSEGEALMKWMKQNEQQWRSSDLKGRSRPSQVAIRDVGR